MFSRERKGAQDRSEWEGEEIGYVSEIHRGCWVQDGT